MGILQKAVETYDSHKSLVGVVQADHEILAPIAHIVTSADIEIVLDENGEFISARNIEQKEKIAIPATEESAKRSGVELPPHPLCDQLWYVADFNSKKHKPYIKQLKVWTESPYSHPKVEAVFAYVQKNHILDDLLRSCVLSDKQITLITKSDWNKEEGKAAEPIAKQLIRWRIQSSNPSIPEACWMDSSLMQSFSEFYLDSIRKKPTDLCMVSGEESVPANKHPRGIVSFKGQAKLISSNDKYGFTFRGRFTDDAQAAVVSYEASQKAHNALRWLIAEQGVVFGDRTFLCWNPGGDKMPAPCDSFRGSFRRRLRPQFTVHNYRKELRSILLGYQKKITNAKGVVICALDAATTARLAVTYYNELEASDYLNRLHQWDSQFCWYYPPNEENAFPYIESPALPDIVNYAFGTPRKADGRYRMDCDKKVFRQQIQRLIACRVDCSRLPKDIVQNLVNRASMPISYDKEEIKSSKKLWEIILFIACAAVHRIKMENNEGDDAMSWELSTPDRSFQYGRLLAAMNQLEQDYYNKTKEDRLTNALKYMSAFRLHPYHVYEQVNRQLTQAYLGRVAPYQRKSYEILTGEIWEILRSFPETELFKPLDDTYLLGFDLQRNEFYKSNKKNSEEE